MGRLIDEVVNGTATGSREAHLGPILALTGAQLTILLSLRLLVLLSDTCQQLLQEELAVVVQLEIMRHASSLDLAAFEDSKYYDQLQQAQQESSYRPVDMVMQVFGLIQSAVTFATMIGLLARLSPWVATAAVLTPIPAFVSQTRYGWRGFDVMRWQSPLRRSMTYITSVMTTDTYAKEVQLFGIGDYLMERYRKTADSYLAANRTHVVRRNSASFGWGVLAIGSSVATFFYVARLALWGRISIGSLTVFLQAANQAQGAFQGVLSSLQGIDENGRYLSSYYELLEKEPTIRQPAEPVPVRRPFRTGIKFHDVSYRYPSRAEYALRNISLTINPGEIVALVGYNGAGKTTIAKLLGRLYDPSEGYIEIDGVRISEYDVVELRREFSMLFQDFAAYEFSASENIGVGNIDAIDEADQILEAAIRAGALTIVDNLPNGLETVLGKWFEGGHQLSGGEWQRIALARAFMRDAQVVILDEPSSALDIRAETDLFAGIRKLTEGRMTLFITHRFSTARQANRIYVLEHGCVKEQGTHEELMNLKGLYAELFELQAAGYS